MKKHIINLKVTEAVRLGANYGKLSLTPADGSKLPEMLPGQFVEIAVPECSTALLRRPISINFVDYERNELVILVRNAGNATSKLIEAQVGDVFNTVLPLGNGFTVPQAADGAKSVLLIGGGVGVAPLLYLGKVLADKGIKPTFLLGARSGKDLLELDEFEKYGEVCVSTEDGSVGEKGLVTQHSVLNRECGMIYCCGPAPMMKAVAAIAKQKAICCEVSLENMMACGVGACLCCVEKTVKGNVCVCTEGPVFNINDLTW
jgi:dihydroorotate dehydrogenase electron transfer subunit